MVNFWLTGERNGQTGRQRVIEPGQSRFSTLVAAHPGAVVAAFAAAQCLAWTLAPALSHFAPPLDVVESYLWGREWVVGTNKHPNLPGWVLEASRLLTGATGWPAYLASQLFVAATYGLFYGLGRNMLGPARAAMGTLLLAGVFYVTWPAIEFNHNVAQMPFWAAITLVLWRLRTRPNLGLWLLLSALGAGVLYAKLSAGLLLVVAGGWILADLPLRRQLLTAAPWFGLALFLLLSVPLFGWLIRAHWQPLLYAAERSTGAGEGPLRFLGAQLLACIGLLALAAICGLFGPLRDGEAAPSHTAVVFLATMTLAPIAAAALVAVAAGSGLKSMWGSPMLGLAGLLTVALTSRRFTPAALPRAAMAAAALLIALPIGYAADTLLEARFTGHIKRQNWPQAAIAARFDALWQAQTHKPLRIVAGERWVAGLAALTASGNPSILTDGSFTLSPWITPERLRAEGALVVWEVRPGAAAAPPGHLAVLIGGTKSGVEQFAVPLFPNAPPLSIGYAIVPPG